VFGCADGHNLRCVRGSQKAQALEDWADCRERAVAKLELKVLQLLSRTERRRLPASGMLPATCMKLRCATVLKPLR
jgi:hypothetical protein